MRRCSEPAARLCFVPNHAPHEVDHLHMVLRMVAAGAGCCKRFRVRPQARRWCEAPVNVNEHQCLFHTLCAGTFWT